MEEISRQIDVLTMRIEAEDSNRPAHSEFQNLKISFDRLCTGIVSALRPSLDPSSTPVAHALRACPFECSCHARMPLLVLDSNAVSGV